MTSPQFQPRDIKKSVWPSLVMLFTIVAIVAGMAWLANHR